MPDDLKQIAQQLTTDLNLTTPPIQITYLESAPPGVPRYPGISPSVCTFFAEGRSGPFYADLKAHEACEVGAFVLGVAPEGELGERLMSTIGLMHQEGYLAPGEEAKIPRNATPPKFVAYGPLGSLPSPPTNVLLFANPKSAMLAVEAAGGSAPMNGRPMCAIVPTLNQGAKVAISVGCIGSRIFTGLPDEQMIVGIRGDHLAAFAQSVKKTRQANQVIGTEDQRRKDETRRPAHP